MAFLTDHRMLCSRQTVSAILVLAVIMAGFPVSQAFVRSSAHYEVPEEVLAASGNIASSAHYTNSSTLAQPGTVGMQVSSSSENQSGFWHTVTFSPAIPALSAVSLAILVIIISMFLIRRKRTT